MVKTKKYNTIKYPANSKNKIYTLYGLTKRGFTISKCREFVMCCTETCPSYAEFKTDCDGGNNPPPSRLMYELMGNSQIDLTKLVDGYQRLKEDPSGKGEAPEEIITEKVKKVKIHLKHLDQIIIIPKNIKVINNCVYSNNRLLFHDYEINKNYAISKCIKSGICCKTICPSYKGMMSSCGGNKNVIPDDLLMKVLKITNWNVDVLLEKFNNCQFKISIKNIELNNSKKIILINKSTKIIQI